MITTRSLNGDISRRDWLPAVRSRAAFSLTELVVVVAIIGILSSLMLSGMLVARESQRAAKTSATIRKLSEVILPYYESYEWRRPMLPTVAPLPTACYKELRRIAIRRLMTMEMPERPLDISDISHTLQPNGGDLQSRQELAPLRRVAGSIVLSEIPPAARRYASLVRSASTSWIAAGKSPASFTLDNVELLHMFVTRGPAADSDVTAHFRPDEIGDSDKDGLPEFLDGWGRPIAFLRWPVGFNSAVQPIAGTLLGVDTAVSEKGHRLVPLIFSAGSDGAVDIGANPAGSYAATNFDPFAYVGGQTGSNPSLMNCFPAESLRNAVNLTPVATGATTTFLSERSSGNKALPPDAFGAIGSERDQNGNGVIESLDNVHSHDLTR